MKNWKWLLLIPVIVCLQHLWVTNSFCAQGENIPIPSLLNMKYLVAGESVKLKKGHYERSKGMDILVVDIVNYDIGDINGDGREEAAVLLRYNAGGSGSFNELAIVTNERGTLRNITTKQIDIANIKSVKIKSGTIIVTGVIHGPDDPNCCPTVHTAKKYVLSGGTLIEQSLGKGRRK